MLRNSGKKSLRSTRQRPSGRWSALCVLSWVCILGSVAAKLPGQEITLPTRINAGPTEPTETTGTSRTSVESAPAEKVTAQPAPQPVLLQSSPVPLEQALETRGDLSLQDATMQKALFTIGASWRVNIVVGNDVKGTVSCTYKQTPLREVLDAILLANGYNYRAVGDSLVVQKSQEVGSANTLYDSASIAVTHGDLQEVMEGARLLLSKQGQIRSLPSAKSMLVIDYADRVESIRAFVAQMDAAAAQSTGGIPAETYQRLQVAYFHTQYIPVESTTQPLTAVLSQAGRVATMPDENRLVVVDYASNIAMVRRVLDRIDRPVPQVRITALIYDVSLQDVEQLGLNWNSAAKGNLLGEDGTADQVLSLGSTTLAPFVAGTPGAAATVKSLTTNFDITAVALLLQNANDARLLANPNVTVMENQMATMSSVQQIPFQQITQSELGGQLGTTAFKDVGVTLNVTPTVAADGTVKLNVQQEFSRVAGFTENDAQPIIDTRIANTIVRVANRKTLVIGGLRQRSDTGDFNGIPFLKDIKYFGALFRSRNTTVRESELLVFLMPEIVAPDEAPSHREYMAQETAVCRLDRIPLAEGCGDGGCQPGGNCAHDFPGSIPLNGAGVPQTPVDSAPYLPPPQPRASANTLPMTQPASAEQTKAVFRQGFEDRYRATGGTDGSRRYLQGGQTSVKDDSRALMNRFRSNR